MYPREELYRLQQMKQTQRKEFDKDPANAIRLEEIKRLRHNYERSQEMFESIKKMGFAGSISDIDAIITSLISVGEQVTIETSVRHPSEIKAPKGGIRVLSTWRILPDGTKYLTTINFMPLGESG